MLLTKLVKRVGGLLCLLAALAFGAGTANAATTFSIFEGSVVDDQGLPADQAGGHPYSAGTKLSFVTDSSGEPVEDLKDAIVSLPPGFVGSPAAVPKCGTDLTTSHFDNFAQAVGLVCPMSAQIGVATVTTGPLVWADVPVYNVEPPPGVLARIGFSALTVSVVIDATVRPGDFGVDLVSRNTSQGLPLNAFDIRLWGVPADPSHDDKRLGNGCFWSHCAGGPAGTPQRAFITNPTDCSAGPLTTTIRANSWQHPDEWATESFDHDVSQSPPTPMEVVNCETLGFDPELTLRPTATAPDSPSGLEVGLTLPQPGLESPSGLGTAHLKRATVTLPEGMTINPAAASGLDACADAQLRLDSGSEPATCPAASKVGSVEVDTPLLEDPLEGSVFIRSQNSDDPTSGEMFRIALELRDDERGLALKLPGQVRANPETGRLETTFDNNPQVPFTQMRLRLKGGSRAPLALPPSCGTKTTTATMTAWSGQVVELTDSFTVDCGSEGGFEPTFTAGATSPIAGSFSPFVARIERGDGQQNLSGVTVRMPKGLIAKLRGVPLCSSFQADNGGCPAGSKIGTATAGAGSGSTPYYVQGDVFLTEGYKGAPYGLAVHVHAKAGPFDLGWVRVRQAINVDPVTAELTVVSDPLPQIVKGVPVRLRSVDVDVDRPDFTINPTSCSEKQIDATLTSIDGIVQDSHARFQVGECRALAFKPRLTMRLTGKGRTRTGAHPGLAARVTQPAGQANIGRAQVTLPKAVVLDATNSADPKLLCGYDEGLKADCPASSIIGKATARTPVLNRPLIGDVHLVQGIKFGKTGNRIRTTPTLLVKLRGEVAIDLRAKTTVRDDRLVTTFPEIPDAPVSRFDLSVNGGKKGILVVTRTRKAKIDVCKRRQVADVETDGHNGKRADFATTVRTPCARKAKADRKGKK